MPNPPSQPPQEPRGKDPPPEHRSVAVGLGYVAGVVHYGDVANVRGELLRDARGVLGELDARARAGAPAYPVCALLLWTGFGDDLEVALERYVTAHWDYVDAWTGRDALVFVPDRNLRANAQRAREVMRYLDVPADAPPCAVFFLPGSDPPQRRLVGRFVRLIPRGPDGSYREGDVAAALRALCAALVTCGQLPVQQRLDILKQEMKSATRGTFGGRLPAEPVSDVRSNLQVGASVLSALAAALGLALKG